MSKIKLTFHLDEAAAWQCQTAVSPFISGSTDNHIKCNLVCMWELPSAGIGLDDPLGSLPTWDISMIPSVCFWFFFLPPSYLHSLTISLKASLFFFFFFSFFLSTVTLFICPSSSLDTHKADEKWSPKPSVILKMSSREVVCFVFHLTKKQLFQGLAEG